MIELGIYIFIITFFSVLAGIIEHNKDLGKIRRIAKKTRALGVRECLALLVWLCIIAMYFIVFFLNLGVSVSQCFIIGVFLFASLSALLLVIIDYKLAQLAEMYPKVTSTIFGSSVLIVTLLTNVYVDYEISKLTSLSASLFPNAQKLILILWAPIFWIFVIILLSFIFYVFHGLITCIRMAREISYVNSLYNVLCLFLGVKRNHRGFNVYMDLAISLGLLIVLVTFPKIISGYTNSDYFKESVSSLLVFSSYREAERSCANIDDPKLAISFLKGNDISIAKFQENVGYRFSVGECIRSR
ncbi:hypothetical protein [Oceanimonas sp. GK1]|uniref:hypothetical protein n=1 Tax=Oceanimonas sp. (strain GK1 / IBRC-M 10197) TaxID=511062 RepID=UPI0011D1E28E|nr:hypothetical protein [Oceanimonas sp. GK1]